MPRKFNKSSYLLPPLDFPKRIIKSTYNNEVRPRKEIEEIINGHVNKAPSLDDIDNRRNTLLD